ncbi:cysteine desulfurase NifS [Tyzzerella sp. OttesenSCG-928-J15]|nr:cysteine desulfurase NifS [Tyzzerella sp. OttesenSCG-928-J15]
MLETIYFDNAATTMMRDEVFEAMKPYMAGGYGNPSSIYKLAREAKIAMEKAREQIATAIGADSSEIYFTGSGTESDNWAIISTAHGNKKKGNHIITSAVEHHAVLHSCEFLEKNGFEVTYLPVNEDGIINIQDLKDAIRPDTVLITIMYANNEIGTVQPVKEIAEIAKEHKIIFHTDAVQAFGHIPVNVKDDGMDMLTISAHKVYGPKGVGALYVRKGVALQAFIHGGGQERMRRAGTENVAGIVGFGQAAALITAEMEEENKRVTDLRNMFIDGVMEAIPYCRLNGHREKRLPGNANISFEFIEGESMLLMLDMKGIAASSGSACTSGSLDPSHVLLAIGLPHEKAHGSLRVTMGRYNTEDDVRKLLAELPAIVQRLRDMSPLYEDYTKQANA